MFWEGEEGTFYISSSPKNLCTHWKCASTTQYFNGFGTNQVIFKLSFLKIYSAQNVKILEFGNGKHVVVSFTFEIGMLCMQTKEMKHCVFC